MIRDQQATGAAPPVERACQLLGVSRSSFYYQPADATARQDGELLLRDAIETILAEFSGYGYRRVTAQLRRDGWTVNAKRVLRVMREHGLLCKVRRRWTQTTQSAHGLRVWPNLLPRQPITGPNQVWVADLTYIRLPHGFGYLAAVLDAWSRKVVGWAFEERIDAALALAALDMALADRRPAPGWIHHSDRGAQYACDQYVERLLQAAAQISMSRKGRPRDNAQAEAFFRTLKVEEVYLQEYRDVADARAQLKRFIADVYNVKRLHSSLGYLPPSEFEDQYAGAADEG